MPSAAWDCESTHDTRPRRRTRTGTAIVHSRYWGACAGRESGGMGHSAGSNWVPALVVVIAKTGGTGHTSETNHRSPPLVLGPRSGSGTWSDPHSPMPVPRVDLLHCSAPAAVGDTKEAGCAVTERPPRQDHWQIQYGRPFRPPRSRDRSVKGADPSVARLSACVGDPLIPVPAQTAVYNGNASVTQ